MLRKLYYILPVSLRYWVRKLYYLPLDIFQKRADLIPPMGLIYTGNGNFEAQGKDWVAFFKANANLNENSQVLDIGSGIGRIAIPLAGYLSGQYHGFDAVKQGVDWCKKKISTKFTNFDFLYVDLFNDLYKDKGIDAATFEFPYEKSSFDFACAISVFTHMIPEEVENYLAQSNQVLKSGGFLVATFFILDDESKKQMSQKADFNFKYNYGNYALMDNDVKSANVAFEYEYLKKFIDANNFEIVNYIGGHWCGRPKQLSIGFQDILILRKK